MEINALFAVALILLLALLAGRLAKLIHIPEVTGYLVAGLALGPSGVNLISEQTLTALNFLSEIAIGLILFSIGSVFEFSNLQRVGTRVIPLVAFEALGAGVLVLGGMLLVGATPSSALLLGAMAMATAPASTILVLREYDAAGPLTDTLTAVVGLNNILALVVYGVVTALLDTARNTSETSLSGALGTGAFSLAWMLLGSLALGFLIALLLTVWSEYVHEHGEILILLIGSILLVVGAAKFLGLSPLIGTVALGATMINLSERSNKLFSVLQQTDPPIYAMFFVIAGADLQVSNLKSLGLAGLTYVLLRVVGKVGGAYWGSRRLKMPRKVQRYLGYGLMAQAGLAIGLVLDIRLRYPELSVYIETIILASVFIYEVIGPIGTRYALIAAGERSQAPTAWKVGDQAELL
ncbi:MAG: cation:proton antiporter [Acidobacteriota bacterium]